MDRNPLKDYFIVGAFFAILTVLTLVTIIYAKEAEQEAREVRAELTDLNVSAQIRCVIRVTLAYPNPVADEEFRDVLESFDTCIAAQTDGVNDSD